MAPERDRPRVSVIVPVRDRAALLAETLEALRAQTCADHEVIVVDDGSTDGTDAVAGRAAEADPRVRVLTTTGIGAVAARTLAVEHATADVLAFTDSDCRPRPDWLERGLARIDAGADLVQGLTRPSRRMRPLERSLWSDFEDGLYATCNVFYRRPAFDRAGGFDQTAGGRLGFRPDRASQGLGIGEDTLLGWRVREFGRVEFAAEAVVEHHVFPPDPRESLRRAWSVGAFPGLVREVPGLRRTLLVDGVFLGGRWRAPLYLAVAATAAGRPLVAAAGTGAWAWQRWTRLRRTDASRRRQLAALPADLACDAVAATALVVGSIRARRAVL